MHRDFPTLFRVRTPPDQIDGSRLAVVPSRKMHFVKERRGRDAVDGAGVLTARAFELSGIRAARPVPEIRLRRKEE